MDNFRRYREKQRRATIIALFTLLSLLTLTAVGCQGLKFLIYVLLIENSQVVLP